MVFVGTTARSRWRTFWPVVLVAMGSLAGTRATANGQAGGWPLTPAGMISACRGRAGASVSIPQGWSVLSPVLSLPIALAGPVELEGLTQVGGPFDDQVGSLADGTGVFGFITPPPTAGTAMIMRPSLIVGRSSLGLRRQP